LDILRIQYAVSNARIENELKSVLIGPEVNDFVERFDAESVGNIQLQRIHDILGIFAVFAPVSLFSQTIRLDYANRQNVSTLYRNWRFISVLYVQTDYRRESHCSPVSCIPRFRSPRDVATSDWSFAKDSCR